MKKKMMSVYRKLLRRFGPQGWWPADSAQETVVGAILAQNTAWANAAKAVRNLKEGPGLSPEILAKLRRDRLARLIRPSGYYNQKAERVKRFARWLTELNHGDWGAYLKQEPLEKVREELLALNGIGPETADSILLYAAGRKTFVIDKYTLRIGARYGLFPEGTTYHQAQELFMKYLPEETELYNEYHALLVALGADYCKTKPVCGECPLVKNCRTGGEKLKG